MNIWIILALIFAALESIALWKKLDKLEYVVKPAVMICLFIWLYLSTGLQGLTLWFGIGILFSLAGDIFLMISVDRMFINGLVAFLLAHIAYLVGFQNELMEVTAWSVLLIVLLAINGVRLIRKIVSSIKAKGQTRLVYPVIVYAIVITVMLYAAMTTISNPDWTTRASFLVSVGAFLFYLSDLILAWNKFVAPIKNGRILNIAAYHLGQIGLIAGVISQLG
ncbi:MAG TPA: lysoplasmalogenase [Anaerolineales bacterium]|nr:lysoplasmalogenase [Anaerolineales bacterium]